jgi:hypothetical protein
VASAAALAEHFAALAEQLAEPESEDSWQRLERALLRLEALTKGGAYKYDEYVPLLKGLGAVVCTSVSSRA